MPSMKRGTYSSCLWTGIANRKYTGGLDISLEYKHTDNGQLVTAMPPDLWQNEIRFLDLYQDMDESPEDYLQSSLCVSWNISNVPPKPKIDERKYPQLVVKAKRCRRLDNMIPERMTKYNMASNEDTLLLLREILEETKTRVKRYRVVLSDINIFDKLIKVKYTYYLIYRISCRISSHIFIDVTCSMGHANL